MTAMSSTSFGPVVSPIGAGAGLRPAPRRFQSGGANSSPPNGNLLASLLDSSAATSANTSPSILDLANSGLLSPNWQGITGGLSPQDSSLLDLGVIDQQTYAKGGSAKKKDAKKKGPAHLTVVIAIPPPEPPPIMGALAHAALLHHLRNRAPEGGR